MKLLLAALVLLTALTAGAIEVTQSDDGAVFIKLSAEEAQACKAEGGCALVTAVGLQQAILRSCGASI